MSKGILTIISILAVGVAVVSLYTNPVVKSKVEQYLAPSKSTSIIMPNKAEMMKLVQNSMHIFALSVKEKRMAKFYHDISPFWQKRTSVEKLNAVFAPFIRAGIDLTVLQELQPIITEGTGLTKKNDLHISGYYNTVPKKVRFEQTYKNDDGRWKLVEFFVEIK